VLALVQLDRNPAQRADKRPCCPTCARAATLENTADPVIGRYWDELDNPQSAQRGLAELLVLKKRQPGDDVGTIRSLVWLGERDRHVARQR
jgi:replicative DNA helicase